MEGLGCALVGRCGWPKWAGKSHGGQFAVGLGREGEGVCQAEECALARARYGELSLVFDLGFLVLESGSLQSSQRSRSRGLIWALIFTGCALSESPALVAAPSLAPPSFHICATSTPAPAFCPA